MDKVKFTDPDTMECVEFYVLEQTTISGQNYLMVTLDEVGDSDAYLLRELPDSDDSEAAYEMVEDEKELEAIAKVFAELLEDVDLQF